LTAETQVKFLKTPKYLILFKFWGECRLKFHIAFSHKKEFD